jgi:hypothetical protein
MYVLAVGYDDRHKLSRYWLLAVNTRCVAFACDWPTRLQRNTAQDHDQARRILRQEAQAADLVHDRHRLQEPVRITQLTPNRAQPTRRSPMAQVQLAPAICNDLRAQHVRGLARRAPAPLTLSRPPRCRSWCPVQALQQTWSQPVLTPSCLPPPRGADRRTDQRPQAPLGIARHSTLCIWGRHWLQQRQAPVPALYLPRRRLSADSLQDQHQSCKFHPIPG